MADEDVTLGELSRRLDRLELNIDRKFTEITYQLNNLQFVNRDTYNAEQQALKERVEGLEDAKRWGARAFVISFLYPAILAFITALVVVR